MRVIDYSLKPSHRTNCKGSAGQAPAERAWLPKPCCSRSLNFSFKRKMLCCDLSPHSGGTRGWGSSKSLSLGRQLAILLSHHRCQPLPICHLGFYCWFLFRHRNYLNINKEGGFLLLILEKGFLYLSRFFCWKSQDLKKTKPWGGVQVTPAFSPSK